jgi:hypothetical protein
MQLTKNQGSFSLECPMQLNKVGIDRRQMLDTDVNTADKWDLASLGYRK